MQRSQFAQVVARIAENYSTTGRPDIVYYDPDTQVFGWGSPNYAAGKVIIEDRVEWENLSENPTQKEIRDFLNSPAANATWQDVQYQIAESNLKNLSKGLTE